MKNFLGFKKSNFYINRYHVRIFGGKFVITLIDETEELFSSENLSKLIGLKVHTDWGVEMVPYKFNNNSTLPDDYKSDKFFNENEYNKLIENYPELKTIKGSEDYRRNTAYHVYNGCVSKYNFDDIKYFCEVYFRNRPQETENKQKMVENKLNLKLGWLPSIQTLNKIENHINKNNIVITKELIQQKLK